MTTNDIFIFSPLNSGRICVYRAAKRYGQSFFDDLGVTRDDVDFLNSKLKIHSVSPFLICADTYPMLVSIAHYHSSGLCVAVSLNCSLPVAKRMTVELFGDGALSPSMKKVGDVKRIPKEQRESYLNVAEFFALISEKHGVIHDTDLYYASLLSRNVLAVAEDFIGCKTEIIDNCASLGSFDYDISLFTVFALCSLVFFYGASLERCAYFELFSQSGTLAAAFHAECTKVTKDSGDLAFSELDAHTKALGLYFGVIRDGNKIKIEHSSVRSDLSLAGLKDNAKLR